MADVTIGDLSATGTGTLDTDDVMEIERDGQSFKVTLGVLISELDRLSTITVVLTFFSPDTAWAVADNVAHFTVPAAWGNRDLTAVVLEVDTASSSGLPTVQLRNIDNGNVDMLSTKVTCDANEKISTTAATPAVINTSNDNVTAYDTISVDVDVAGTGTTGGRLLLTFT